ncbi:MAG: amidohydrolase family protein, partial [Chloroflexota bacterium]|nr:amidohydrolase family protein [Chloroflexota bacterium]
MTAFDLLILGGTVIDGSGGPGVRADVGVVGDRIAAVGNLSSAADAKAVAHVLDAAGRVVCPGFVDPHGHSDASVLLDPAVASHLHQGYTTQVSGNCGDSLAPVAEPGREMVELAMAETGLEPTWRAFGDYLAVVEDLPLGPNHAFLVGHGTIRGAVVGPVARVATKDELKAMVRHLEEALDAGAIGLSSGLIYPPGIHAPTDELVRLATVCAGRGGLYASHIRNESDGLFVALDEAVETIRAAGPGARLQVSHLKAGSRSTWGRGPEAVERLERARTEGL